ncbi:branched-chain amino acid transport system II carrier protein [Lactobacillus sp. PV037]|uniref:branched-chain amino acid transport system II carrier protein n=1 Tax=unclassified Lactobacillus TaxID=2620435 RepID=UPI002240C041|nr:MULTISPECIES: branched-chain amino acid transport system II carrier protein [unclassified Lactobacillus]QNQ81664.1 branched-chain amino acid transport system II carrier protein [Lactobacillus sp. PV012]QNQ84289.1 branched-chain amino acid transport system II carrier protein [Lactobacillus sp. PV037]
MKDKEKLSTKQYLVVASMIFALFFGAGNLIFPLHLGQLAGAAWLQAAVGFLLTGVALPLLSLLAIAITRSNGVYDLSKPVGGFFALAFMTLIQLTIGPLYATPRLATVSYTVGVKALLPKQFQGIGLIIFVVLFFAVVYGIAFKQSDILSSLGKVLNPIFLVALFLVFVVAFAKPLGNPAAAPVTPEYAHGAFINGFLQGYNTLDALAGLVFGVAIVTAIKTMGVKKEAKIAAITVKSGTIGMLAIGVIYVALVLMGAMSLGHFKVSADGGQAFSQIVTYYAGVFGQAFLAFLIVLTCLTTAVGLVASFAEDFQSHFGGLSYRGWLTVTCGFSALFACFGLDELIKWSVPVLMFLYPLAIVVIVLSMISPLIKKDHVVYKITIILTLIPSVLDFIYSLPEPLKSSNFVKSVDAFRLHYFPLANLGITWMVPAIIGIILGILVHIYRRKTSQI